MTVEIALGMFGLMGVVALVFVAFAVASAQAGACADAREALRSATRGGEIPAVTSVVTIGSSGQWKTAHATRTVPGASSLGIGAVECQVTGRSEEW